MILGGPIAAADPASVAPVGDLCVPLLEGEVCRRNLTEPGTSPSRVLEPCLRVGGVPLPLASPHFFNVGRTVLAPALTYLFTVGVVVLPPTIRVCLAPLLFVLRKLFAPLDPVPLPVSTLTFRVFGVACAPLALSPVYLFTVGVVVLTLLLAPSLAVLFAVSAMVFAGGFGICMRHGVYLLRGAA